MILSARKPNNLYPEPLHLSDIVWLEIFFNDLVNPIADINATSILTWRKEAHLEYLIEDDVLYVFGDSDFGRALWLPPIGGRDLSSANILRGFELLDETQGEATCHTVHNLWDQYPLWPELQFNAAFLINPESMEYHFDILSLADLDGHGLKSKRADVRFFLNTYQPRITSYDACLASDCICLLDRWLIQKKDRCAGPVLDKVMREYEVCKMALHDSLPLKGVVCIVNSRLVAFSLGVAHGHRVFNCLFEKADLALRGCSAFIFSSLAKSLYGRFVYINAGEDWGLHELAFAKQLWHPKVTRQIYNITQRLIS